MDVRALTAGRPTGRAFKQAVVSGYVSRNQAAPASAADPLFVVIPSHSTSGVVRFDVWPQLHGSTLPVAGAVVTVAYDEKGVPRVVDWYGAYTAAAGTGGGTPQIVTVNTNTTIAASDQIVIVNAPVTVTLPATASAGEVHDVKDATGNASAAPITVSGNGRNIDDAATYQINTNFESLRVVGDGTNWHII